MTRRLRRSARIGFAAAVLTATGSLAGPGPAQAADPPGWDACGRRDTGSSLCMFDRSPPVARPSGFAPGATSFQGRCWNAGEGLVPGGGTTRYVVNHSLFAFYVYDGRDCTGRRLTIAPRESGGMPARWTGRLASVEMCCAADALAPSARLDGETLVDRRRPAR